MYASGRCWEFLFYATWGRHAATMTKARGNSAAASTIAIVRKEPDDAGRNNDAERASCWRVENSKHAGRKDREEQCAPVCDQHPEIAGR